MLKLHQRFRSDNHNVFAEEINKIALSDSNDKRIQSSFSTTLSVEKNVFHVI